MWLPREPPKDTPCRALTQVISSAMSPGRYTTENHFSGDRKMSINSADLPVALTKAAAMRYIAETVGHGYFLFQSGAVPASKLAQLIEKFDREYRVLATRGMRDNDRIRGRSCARLIVFPKVSFPVEKFDGEWLFWLLATEGDGPLPHEKCTRDTRNRETRLRWEAQYELVSRPVRRRNGDLDYVWTWVFQEAFFERWKRVFAKAAGRVRSSKQRKPHYLVKLVTALRNVPGFHGVNRQKKALIVGTDIPKQWHVELHLNYLGSVVNKALPVFGLGRTVLRLLGTDDLSAGNRNEI
jgi:hypothetical protein